MDLSTRRLCVFAVALVFCLPLPALAQKAGDAPAPGDAPSSAEAKTSAKSELVSEARQSGPQVSSFTLDNGLKVLVLPDHRAPIVTQMIYYKVGAADEAPGKSGIAHFLEHLMFKGTKSHPQGAFSAAVADIGGQENAFTSFDYTGYYQTVPADALKTVMAFEADRMENLVLSDEVVLPERDVILEERRMRIDNDPGAQLSEAVQAALFQNSPYGIPVIGWRSEMEKLSRQDAIAFYDRFYTPNNATLLIAGDVTPGEVRKLAGETFGQVARRADPGRRVRPAEPEPLAARTVTLTDPRVTQPTMQRAYLVPSESNDENDEAESLDILADILGGGTTSRLYRDLVVDKGIAASAGAYYSGTAVDDGQFVLYGTPRGAARLGEVEQAIDAELKDIRKNGVTAEEVERAKNRIAKNLIYLRDSQTATARRYAAALSTGQTLKEVETWPERIAKVTPDDVKAVADKYLKAKRSVTGYLLPEPPAGEVADAANARAVPGRSGGAAPAIPALGETG